MNDSTKRTMIILTIAIVMSLILAPLAVVAYYVWIDDEDEHQIQGAFVVTNPENFVRLGDYCAGEGPFAILESGTDVRVWDANGNVLATGSTNTGDQQDSTCSFQFTLDDVPNADEYHFQFGDHPVYVMTSDNLKQSDWNAVIIVDQAD